MDILSPQSQAGTRLAHVGRQPIFDSTGDVVAYELLFRGSTNAVTATRRDAYATSEVIVNTFTEFGIEEVVGDRLCFINLTRDFLVGDLALPFGPDNVVLEVLETVDVCDDVIAGVAALVEQGYSIALDDFVWGSGHERLLSFASYVKLDLLDLDRSHLDEVVAACRAYPGIQIVAEGLETGEHLALCNSYGFELRQGYVLSRPQVLTASSIAPSKLRRLELLSALCAAEPDLDRIISAVVGDPALTIRVLRASNSVAAGSTSRVSSVRQAVVLLGVTQIRRWAVLMVVEDITEAAESQLIEALTRARLCQILAPKFGAHPDAGFMAGLITAVAELLGVSAASMAHRLPLTADIEGALERGAGPLGQMLRVVGAYQRGDVGQAAAAYEADNLTRAVMEAMRWASQAVHSSHGPYCASS
ncbi:EAL and HDOD domain-containing protein [Paractinoplanes hotanensis]|uniref:HDOD domain-containing protein n=1 Tax=Paractinoplanes hotanensis TaxID=2906497 RepID=A0ABT0YGE9_9ACTN|nr:HDOD domain-containing protein [Actinoplanes hotanensis]MCM4085162.1 HDOD domain-containing protein [Actinoplanes hotanensis]